MDEQCRYGYDPPKLFAVPEEGAEDGCGGMGGGKRAPEAWRNSSSRAFLGRVKPLVRIFPFPMQYRRIV